ncbi:hypothetical protein GCM10022226_48230 [Sphaerisporangium flaviroseum]|uniref:DUF397 domain-containing protein n=1 Tax=Sphaerisporangium flaviroseum TaxID=509199 RepID=A0ABP7IMI3_9ACTN
MDLSKAQWHKSAFSGDNGGHCVEVASNLPCGIVVRDSKDLELSPLIFSPDEWSIFLKKLKNGQ